MPETPCYIFDIDEAKARIALIRQKLPGIPLTFSVKANSFIVKEIEESVDHIEVCSPGELEICRQLRIAPEKIIYSGVMKEEADLRDAVRYGSGIVTAESEQQLALIDRIAREEGKAIRVLLRVSSGNQFGMDPRDIIRIMESRASLRAVSLIGFHFYSGTQKKKETQFRKDFDQLSVLIEDCRNSFGFSPALVEYGPGLAVEYFREEADRADLELLELFARWSSAFTERYPVGIELGRFIAAPCGQYVSAVKDLKVNGETHYAILDGGIHHLKYHGQMMAMNSPHITQEPTRDGELRPYCLCGSLCTVADVLAKTELKELKTGDRLTFDKCGAYSVTEASALFLSREMPAVYLRKAGQIRCARKGMPTYGINCPSDVK